MEEKHEQRNLQSGRRKPTQRRVAPEQKASARKVARRIGARGRTAHLRTREQLAEREGQGKQASAVRQRRAEFADDMRQAFSDPRANELWPQQRAARKTAKWPRAVAFALIVAVVAIGSVALFSTFCQADHNKLRACEEWRSTVHKACVDTKLGEQWEDALLALMAVESGGDVNVESVEGVSGDVMQAAEGAYGDIVKDGSDAFDVKAQTPEASIYAGALEFKQNLDLWKKYLNGIGVGEESEVQLVVQGYNFGSEGWYTWCKERGITEYSVESAREYSETQMPEDAKGTPTHAEKWLGFYRMERG